MRAYKELVHEILHSGNVRTDRTGVGTRSLFGRQIRFDLANGFPLVTLKKTPFGAVVRELLWFIAGDTNVRSLQTNNVHIWDEWADDCGELGPIYGRQWRSWPARFAGLDPIDQLADVIAEIKAKPDSRRLLVSAWNVAELPEMRLAPCHCLFQFYVHDDRLSCQLYQRSADVFLGVPFNIASYALLTHMIAQVCGLKVGEFVHTFGDVHLYLNHHDQAWEMLNRMPAVERPILYLDPNVTSIDEFKFEDIALLNYHPHPAIKAQVAV